MFSLVSILYHLEKCILVIGSVRLAPTSIAVWQNVKRPQVALVMATQSRCGFVTCELAASTFKARPVFEVSASSPLTVSDILPSLTGYAANIYIYIGTLLRRPRIYLHLEHQHPPH